jgi:hypothetical protein
MIQIIKRGLVFILVLLFCSFIPVGFTRGQTSPKGTKLGDLFPSYAFPPSISSQDRTYLGLAEEKPFTLGDIQADLIVLELLNIYCTSCQKQASMYNEVFDLVERDPVMKDKVKWMGGGGIFSEAKKHPLPHRDRFPFRPL